MVSSYFCDPNKSIIGGLSWHNIYKSYYTCKKDKLLGYNDYTLYTEKYQGYYYKAENNIPTFVSCT